MKKILSIILLLPLFASAQLKVKDLPNKTSNFKQGDNLIIDDSAGTSGATKKITIGNLKLNYGFITGSSGTISGLTTDFLPIATSAVTLGNSFISQDGTHVYFANSKTLSDLTGQSGLTFGTGVNTELFWRDGLNTSKFHADSGQVYLSFSNDFGHSGTVKANHANTYLSHSDLIKLDAPLYRFEQATPSKLAYWDASKNLKPLALSGLTLSNDTLFGASSISGLTTDYFPIATSSSTIGNSSMYESVGSVLNLPYLDIALNNYPPNVFLISNNSSHLEGSSTLIQDVTRTILYPPDNTGGIQVMDNSKVYFASAKNIFATQTANRVLFLNWEQSLTSSAVDSSELSCVDGVTSSIQTQLNTKLAKVDTSYLHNQIINKLNYRDTSLLHTEIVSKLSKVDTAIFNASDFNQSGHNITIDYTNGQKASSSLPGFVSTTTQTFAGNKTIAGSLTDSSTTINGTYGNGFIELKTQVYNPSAPSSGTRIFSNSNSKLSWRGSANTYVKTFDGAAATSDRVYSLPDVAGTVAVMAQSSISASAIDWNYTHLYKTLGANTTFTFSNAADAKTIIVAITNTASNYTVTWPTVDWGVAGAPVQRTGAVTDIYTFVQINGTIYGAVRQ